ncbi:5-formyltetrahydrofolate cyclo-ligase [Alkalihalobacterium elongatum]|uniref:5-formyltetrahydrofolate cyclo-ligase n=1 Tax=Alkalihalobacterium elongatum TaxID=2675466 RepID=UPI001C1F7713|nr:5-formyltetrahydrofolate cyclo-ligase [Alkalihalobacterium elongatum]
MQPKNVIRTLIKNKLKEMTQEEYKSKSKKIFEQLCSTSLWKNATTVAITISRGNEVDTYPIIERAWREGKKIAVPKTYPETSEMVFFQIKNFNELESTYFQLKEPIQTICVPVDKDQLDLILVPGVAFDKNGNRLGYGGGYYDRYLEDFRGETCALTFEQQLVDDIPLEPFDIPVQMIVTEDQVYMC